MLQALVLAFFSAFQPLDRSDLKEFQKSFELLHVAHSKGRAEIVAKYGPDVLAKFDLVQVQFEPGSVPRNSYDSLVVWVADAKSRLRVFDVVLGLDSLPPSRLAEALVVLEAGRAGVADSASRERIGAEGMRVARQAFGEGCPLDTLFRARTILPQRYRTELVVDRRVEEGLEEEYRKAFNGGRDDIASFARRFPGERESQVRGALDFAEVDETNALLASKTKEGLLKLYKRMEAGSARRQVAERLEKIMYSDWHNARLHEAEVRAAKDFVQTFKDEPKKSAKFREIESWLYFASNPAPVARVETAPAAAAAAPQVASALPAATAAAMPQDPFPIDTTVVRPMPGTGVRVLYPGQDGAGQ